MIETIVSIDQNNQNSSFGNNQPAKKNVDNNNDVNT
jgi:hypothetical protein